MKEGKCKEEKIGNNNKIDADLYERREMQERKHRKQ
jgi:hypothetical protein